MNFKTPAIKAEFSQLCHKAQVLAYAIDGYMQNRYDIGLFITSIIRDNSVQHKAGFAFDFRDIMTKAQGDEFVEDMNDAFFYADDSVSIFDERKKASKNWSAPHFHAQINYRNGDSWK